VITPERENRIIRAHFSTDAVPPRSARSPHPTRISDCIYAMKYLGIGAENSDRIMGHWFRGKGIAERYGKVSDQELPDAMDRMTFENGDTEV